MSARRPVKRASQSAGQVDLARLFSTVTTTLKENQQSLNQADEYNHNHGDNMVDSFQVITKAMRSKKGAAPAEQLEFASQMLGQRAQSGSAQLYTQGLASAAAQMQGKQTISQEDALRLVQALMGGGQMAAPAGVADQGGTDMLGSLLGGLLNAQGASPSQSQSAGGDLLGGLLGGLLGQAAPDQAPAAQPQTGAAGIDVNTLLAAGMAFYQARQQGAEPAAALVQAVLAGSQMMSSTHRSQSGQLVAGTLITTLEKMLSGAKR